MGHEAWHEPYESLSPETRDIPRAPPHETERCLTESFTFRVLVPAGAVRIGGG